MQRSKRKDLKVYCVYSSCEYDFCGKTEDGDSLLGIYFSKEVALHDLINALNYELEANITEYSDEVFNEFIFRHQEKCMDRLGVCPSWRIDEVVVNDKEKIMEVI